MEGKQSIYYALGILAYAMAKFDGKIQSEEKEILFGIVKDEIDHDIDFEYAEIIFKLLERDKLGMEATYSWAMQELKKGRHYLSPELKSKMISTLEKVMNSIEKVPQGQKDFLDRFKNDIELIGSDHYLK